MKKEYHIKPSLHKSRIGPALIIRGALEDKLSPAIKGEFSALRSMIAEITEHRFYSFDERTLFTQQLALWLPELVRQWGNFPSGLARIIFDYLEPFNYPADPMTLREVDNYFRALGKTDVYRSLSAANKSNIRGIIEAAIHIRDEKLQFSPNPKLPEETVHPVTYIKQMLTQSKWDGGNNKFLTFKQFIESQSQILPDGILDYAKSLRDFPADYPVVEEYLKSATHTFTLFPEALNRFCEILMTPEQIRKAKEAPNELKAKEKDAQVYKTIDPNVYDACLKEIAIFKKEMEEEEIKKEWQIQKILSAWGIKISGCTLVDHKNSDPIPSRGCQLKLDEENSIRLENACRHIDFLEKIARYIDETSKQIQKETEVTTKDDKQVRSGFFGWIKKSLTSSSSTVPSSITIQNPKIDKKKKALKSAQQLIECFLKKPFFSCMVLPSVSEEALKRSIINTCKDCLKNDAVDNGLKPILEELLQNYKLPSLIQLAEAMTQEIYSSTPVSSPF